MSLNCTVRTASYHTRPSRTLGGFDQPRSTATAKVNYYGVKGSRAKLGFYGVFGVHIPVMFAGEEADMDAVYMPSLTTGAYEGQCGKDKKKQNKMRGLDLDRIYAVAPRG